MVTTITEYFWNYQVAYSLEALRGVGADDGDRMQIWSGQRQTELKTSSKTPAPHPEVRSPAISKEATRTACTACLYVLAGEHHLAFAGLA